MNREKWLLLAATAAALLFFGWSPYDRLTWNMEVAPVLIGMALLAATGRRFPLSSLLYRLLFLHGLVLMVGGCYTYARVPAGFWVQEWLGLSRNPYDRLGHFFQGFVPAILVRELLLRRSPLRRGKGLAFLVVCVCLAFSAFYEMIEWWSAVGLGDSASDFLGTQGDVWDTQWDMFMALSGAVTAQLLLARVHDRSMGVVAGDHPH
jgi:putative membrane protein